MLDGLFILLSLSVVMALASFLAGAFPISMTLSSSQLRLISSIGMGVLVGTSLVVIIPEGIEAVYTAGSVGHSHSHSTRSSSAQSRGGLSQWDYREVAQTNTIKFAQTKRGALSKTEQHHSIAKMLGRDEIKIYVERSDMPTDDLLIVRQDEGSQEEAPGISPDGSHSGEEAHEEGSPTFYIGLSLVLGFILMFLVDKIPQYASENLQSSPTTRHISLNNLSQGLHEPDISTGEDESESFLHSMAPTPKQSRSLATTMGLVIHSTADGIAMGATASTDNTELGFIIFFAIMVHKAPAAFGLTSVLLRQGLSKRAARGHLVVFSLAAPFGALSTWLLVNLLGGAHIEGTTAQWWTGMLLLFSGGTFLYVAMHTMQDEQVHEHPISNGYGDGSSFQQRKQPKSQLRDTLAAVGGMLIPLLTQFGHHH